jgi:hypothetical protein
VPAASSFLCQWGPWAALSHELDAPTLDTFRRHPRGTPGVETPDAPRTAIADDPMPDLRLSKASLPRKQRRLGRAPVTSTITLQVVAAWPLALQVSPERGTFTPLGRGANPPRIEEVAHSESANRAAAPALTRKGQRRRAYGGNDRTLSRTSGRESLREEQDPAFGSRCLRSRGPAAAISRGADGQVNVRTRLAIDAHGDCSPHEWTTSKLAIRGLFPVRGRPPSPKVPFLPLDRASVRRDQRPRGSSGAGVRPPSSQHPQTSSTSTIEARGL